MEVFKANISVVNNIYNIKYFNNDKEQFHNHRRRKTTNT